MSMFLGQQEQSLFSPNENKPITPTSKTLIAVVASITIASLIILIFDITFQNSISKPSDQVVSQETSNIVKIVKRTLGVLIFVFIEKHNVKVGKETFARDGPKCFVITHTNNKDALIDHKEPAIHHEINEIISANNILSKKMKEIQQLIMSLGEEHHMLSMHILSLSN
ncbi:hypothetical protein ACJX0J_039805, partial [Zea mays]